MSRIPSIATVSLLVLAPGLPAAQPTIELGPPEVVFDHATDACVTEDIPDIPVRAFVDAGGFVHLIAGHFELFESMGPNLSDVSRRCTATVFNSHHDPDPDLFNDAEWLHATYTLDGQTVYGLVHNEYHGWEHANCSSSGGDIFNCWWNAITSVQSTDMGSSYDHPTPPAHGVVLPITAYDPTNTSGPYGFFNPSNIIQKDGHFYSLFQAEAHNLQDWGVCLMRAQDLSDPASWRTWNGTAFLGNPRGNGLRGEACPVLSRPNIGKMHNYVSYNRYLEKYLVVGEHNVGGAWGFYFSTSDDLITWGPAETLLLTNLWWTGTTNDTKRGYVATLQPGDPTANFEETSRSPYIYFTEWRPSDGTYARNMVRRRIRFSLPGEGGRYDVLSLEMNERTGLRTLDSSFYGNDATVELGAWSLERATGPTSLALSGGGSRVVVPHDASLDLSDSLSIEAFLRVDMLDSILFTSIATKDGGPGARNYGLYVAPLSASRPGALHFSVSVGGSYSGTLGRASIADGRWHHVAVTFDEGNQEVRYYIDGDLDAAVPFSADPGAALSPTPLTVGQNLFGLLDSVRIWNHVRTPQEIETSSLPSGNVEICNGFDDTGEGTIDEGCPVTNDAGVAEVGTDATVAADVPVTPDGGPEEPDGGPDAEAPTDADLPDRAQLLDAETVDTAPGLDANPEPDAEPRRDSEAPPADAETNPDADANVSPVPTKDGCTCRDTPSEGSFEILPVVAALVLRWSR